MAPAQDPGPPQLIRSALHRPEGEAVTAKVQPAPQGAEWATALPAPSAARVLIVEGHGAYSLDLAVGAAVPLGADQWRQLHALPAPPEATAARLLALPGHQPVFLRWPSRWPEWFDHHDRRWVPVDASALNRARAEIRRSAGFEAHFDHFPVHGVCADCARSGHDAGHGHAHG